MRVGTPWIPACVFTVWKLNVKEEKTNNENAETKTYKALYYKFCFVTASLGFYILCCNDLTSHPYSTIDFYNEWQVSYNLFHLFLVCLFWPMFSIQVGSVIASHQTGKFPGSRDIVALLTALMC